jgi:nicotinamide phosphoribosyltransferase
MTNLILSADSYKASHFLQYPQGTEVVNAYIEARGGAFPVALFFGLQAFVKQYLLQRVTAADIEEAAEVLAAHGEPFNRAGWQHIVDVHGGYLPLEIEALPEGSVTPLRNAVVQLRNTDPDCGWLTSYVETALLRAVWYPSTVATLSWHAKQIIRRYLEATGSAVGLEYRLHDFGARGASSDESAALGGLAHLVNFRGTDTLAAVIAGRRWYNTPMAGTSIPAAEHSTITAWGRAMELDAYENMLDQFARPGSVLACVSDSYDLWAAIDLWGQKLKSKLEASGATLVVRPDSGNPLEVVPAALERLMTHFGYRTNELGYRVLPDHVRLIQGDGVDLASIEAILDACRARALSAANLSFGMGGALLQRVHRDTMQWAMKISAAQVAGQWREVYKSPVTDPGKRSKRGRLAVVPDLACMVTTVSVEDLRGRQNLLRPVFRNGELLIEENMATVRTRADAGLAWVHPAGEPGV